MIEGPHARLVHNGYTRFRGRPIWAITLVDGAVLVAPDSGPFEFIGTKGEAVNYAQHLIDRYFPRRASDRATIVMPRDYRPTVPPPEPAGASDVF